MADIDDILAAIKAIPEQVGYQKVGATGASMDTYLLAINGRLSELADKTASAVKYVKLGDTDQSLQTFILATNPRVASVETRLDEITALLNDIKGKLA